MFIFFLHQISYNLVSTVHYIVSYHPAGTNLWILTGKTLNSMFISSNVPRATGWVGAS